jgi:hypothetical protein
VDETIAPVAGPHRPGADARGLTRRQMIRRAAAAGAVAWTAPAIIDSLASPAAAQTCGPAVSVASILSPAYATTDKGSTSFTTGTMTTASTSGHTVLLLVVTNQLSASESLAATGGPVASWTEITHLDFSSTKTPELWTLWALRGSGNGTKAAVTITTVGATTTEVIASVLQVANENTSSPIASNPTHATVGGATASVTFAAPASTCNAQVLLVGNIYAVDKTKSPSTWTPPPGFTELTDTNTGTGGTISQETSWRAAAAAGTVTATPTNAGGDAGAIGIEISGA